MTMRNVKRKALLIFLIALFAGANFFSCGNFQAKADTAEEIQDHLDDLMKKQKEAEAELATEQSKLYKNQAQINATQALVKQIKDEITRREEELKNLEDRARLNKTMLAEYIRQLYYANQENDPLISLAMFQGNLSDMVLSFDSTVSIKEKIMDALQVINDAKTKNEQAKEELSDQQASHQQTLKSQQVQQAQITDNIQDTQAILAELQRKLAELQSDLAKLTGVSFDAKDIREAVEFASDHTRVPKGVLYGFLGAETHFNANTGQCTYKEVKKDAMKNYERLLKISKNWQASIDKLEERKDIFEDIVDKLGYSENKKVSCTPRCDLWISGKNWGCSYKNGYIGQGGAMGVAQFMSDVWKYSYESAIRAKTGHKNPDPWNITDGVMAMALKLEKAGATSDKASVIRSASISYLGSFNQSYYNNIIYWSKNYKTLFP